ncbi:N-glycanase [Maribacter sp. ANRC-HE7]|uniref:N-glycanase n=1 Tax=Maribacter aquimaris TaxID=2737171 RepID=A0ABR7V3W9_9FLAO|nr:PNGase F N-terminal domain-containing protein [Maribacter aquimaris]MBD0779050.1 N-glycanase [Maribacter aquimaris]
MKNRVLLIVFILIFGFLCASALAQKSTGDLGGIRSVEGQNKSDLATGPLTNNYPFKEAKEFSIGVFKNQPVNFGGETGDTTRVKRLQNGRVIYRKINVPVYKKGTDVSVEVKLRSNGDKWDKSGSCFVVTDPERIDVIDVSLGQEEFPEKSFVDKGYGGILKTEDYIPALELMRFMSPFGVGHYSDEKKYPKIEYNRPVYIPKWENEVVWKKDISELESVVTGEFYIGIWIDTWTPEGYSVDVTLKYSGRSRPKLKVMPLLNTMYYVEGQKIPDFFAATTLDLDFTTKQELRNVKLYYTTTGHGGHSGGDEFIKLRNEVFLDSRLVLSKIPWRDDCASFRRFNPSSGVWTKKDSAYAYNENFEREFKEIEERLASSDLSRSNWCPGSSVMPYVVPLGELKKGIHELQVKIPGTANKKDQYNHWLVSAYITYIE